jgi:glycosyltransferase involved in cell wall biosynthesis
VRILYLHQYFATPAQSGGTRSFEMARRLVAAGHEVNLLTTSAMLGSGWAPGRGWHVHDIEGIRLHVTASEYSNMQPFRRRLSAFFRFAWQAARRMEHLAADLIFASSTPLTVGIPAVIGARRQDVPMVFEVRDLWPEIPIAIGALRNRFAIAAARALESWVYRHAVRIVALSPGMAEGIAARGYPRDRIAVIPNAADLGIFAVDRKRREEVRHRYPWLGERPLVLYAGTIGIINAVEYMVRLAADAAERAPDIRFLIIGEGNRGEAVAELAGRLGVLDRNLFILPPMPKLEVAAFVAAADISLSLVAPIEPLWRNSANKLFDAMAAGTAIAINYGGWQAEIIRGAGAGIVLDPHDVGSASRQLCRTLADPEWVAAAGIRGRHLAEESYDRDCLAWELETLLVEATSDRDEDRHG